MKSVFFSLFFFLKLSHTLFSQTDSINSSHIFLMRHSLLHLRIYRCCRTFWPPTAPHLVNQRYHVMVSIIKMAEIYPNECRSSQCVSVTEGVEFLRLKPDQSECPRLLWRLWMWQLCHPLRAPLGHQSAPTWCSTCPSVVPTAPDSSAASVLRLIWENRSAKQASGLAGNWIWEDVVCDWLCHELTSRENVCFIGELWCMRY